MTIRWNGLSILLANGMNVLTNFIQTEDALRKSIPLTCILLLLLYSKCKLRAKVEAEKKNKNRKKWFVCKIDTFVSRVAIQKFIMFFDNVWLFWAVHGFAYLIYCECYEHGWIEMKENVLHFVEFIGTASKCCW